MTNYDQKVVTILLLSTFRKNVKLSIKEAGKAWKVCKSTFFFVYSNSTFCPFKSPPPTFSFLKLIKVSSTFFKFKWNFLLIHFRWHFFCSLMLLKSFLYISFLVSPYAKTSFQQNINLIVQTWSSKNVNLLNSFILNTVS